MKTARLLALCATLVGIASASWADRPPNAVTPVTLADTSRHLLHSSDMNQTFRIEVAMPPRLAPAMPETYPVVYVVDGNGLFPLVYANTRALQRASELVPLIVVGIGYETSNQYEIGALRTRHLTPTRDKAFEDQMNSSGLPLPFEVTTGHAPNLAAFIEKELKPFVNANFPVDTGNETFAGYSLGGLFGLYVLFNRPDLFDNYVLGSPSIWWDQNLSFTYEENYARNNDDLPKSVFISSGTADMEMMVSGARTMHKKLADRQYPNLHLEYLEFEGETHSSGIGVALNRGIKQVASKQRIE